VGEDYAFEPGSKEGIVVMSTRVNHKCGGGINVANIDYEGIVGQDIERGMFMLTNAMVGHDFENPPGYYHMRKLPAGEYRFTKMTAASTKGVFKALNDLDILFTVAPGKVCYLGEFYVDIPNCSNFTIRFNDQRQRDGALFDKRMKKLNSRMFVYQIPKSRS
jgi:hypothetical protein